ncbi:RNA polymerase sigma factor [Candidatus Stoquefichus massiliensis]|uniref:RNA polymerase sigma factor n=1 Tax=Candidatus Stoquefichus massiliensis TaxID=1470350 RepID=UPI0004862CB9|nr:sigma-70 family RNA polymerase sigma factor [Candidatus Stoquefichus massiliensis]
MDNLIIEKMKQHDESGIVLLKNIYLPLILYILQSFPLNHQDHEECINDIILKVWNSIDQYNYQLSLKNYIALITRRVALNYVRKKNQYPLSYEDMDIFASDDQYEKIPWDHILKKLNHKEKILFYRRYYYFQSIETISLELGMTYKSAESHLYRLRKKLQRFIREEGYDG